MTGSGGSGADDFEAMARQYWDAWSATLRQGAAVSAATPDDGGATWRKAIDAWTPWLPSGTLPQAEDAISRMRQQAGDWLGAMQQVAAQFAGRDASSAEVAAAWKRQMQGQHEQMLQWWLGATRGAGTPGDDPWLQQAAQWMQGLQRDGAPWLQMPGFGPARNHHARWRALAQAQQDYQAQWQAYLGQLQGAIDRAFAVFEEKLRTHEQPGRQLSSARAMFDLWIDAAEEAYAAAALSKQFRQVYADFANAQMRLRALLQRETEQVCEQLGLPTRTELDAAHRRVADLERRLRRLERGAGQGTHGAGAATSKPTAKPATSTARPSTRPAPSTAAEATSETVSKVSAPGRSAASTPPPAAPAPRGPTPATTRRRRA